MTARVEREAMIAFHTKEADRLFNIKDDAKARSKARWHIEMVKVLEAGIHRA